MKRFRNEIIIGCTGKPLTILNESSGSSELLLEHVLRIIFQNIQPADQNDTTLGKSLMLALDNFKGKEFIELEDTVHEWLVRQTLKIIYRLPMPIYPNGDIIMGIIKDGYIKEEGG